MWSLKNRSVLWICFLATCANARSSVTLDKDSPLLTWDPSKIRYNISTSSISILPDPQTYKGSWSNVTDYTDFDNTIPTFEYSNGTGDLASAASYGAGSYRKGYPEGRQYDGDRSNMPLVTYFDVKCDKSSMHVHVEFNKPFNGIIFSKGFFNEPGCRYVPAKSYGRIYDFKVPINYCGTTGEDRGYDYKDSFAENTIIIQFDEYIQEVWDLAKTIRCEWNAYYDKSVAVRPYSVGNLDPVLYRFNGDNIESWIQVQKGKGPWAEEVYGIVKVGDPLTLVIGINDEDKKFDMQVKDCFATDGYGARVQLTDYYGCVVRDKIMSPFRKIRDYGHHASVVAYAYFQAFKFPDRYEVGIKCNIQVCLGKCQGGCPSSYGDDYKKPLDNNYDDKEPGYGAPPGYGPPPGPPGPEYDQGYPGNNPVGPQNVPPSMFGKGPYVPDIPPGPPRPPSMYAADTQQHPSVVNTLGQEVDLSGMKTLQTPENKLAGLTPYRRRRSVNETTAFANETFTTTVGTVMVHNDFLKSQRTPKIMADDGQFNVDRKFKVISPHEIQSDNINLGPTEVSLAKSNAICIAVSSFTVAVTLLTAVLILSILITFFVCMRMRKYQQKLMGTGAIPVKLKESPYAEGFSVEPPMGCRPVSCLQQTFGSRS